jgi:hypothetical protein
VTPTSETQKRLAGASEASAVFVTSEWEAAADWQVPDGWPPAGTHPDAQHGAFFATGPQPLPEWLSDLAEPPAPAKVSRPPLPRRRDLRRGTAEMPVVREPSPAVPLAPRDLAAPTNHVLGEVLATPAQGVRDVLPGGAEARRPGDLPRRRDVHRPDRSAARRAAVAAYSESQHPVVQGSRLPVAAARLGVVSVLVAVGAGVIGGEQLGILGDDVTTINPAESAAALSLAPLSSSAPTSLSIWDDMQDREGLSRAAEKLADLRAAAAAKIERKRLLAEKQRLAVEKQQRAAELAARRAEEARERATRDAQRNPKPIARILVRDHGWSSEQFQCLDLLWTRESRWDYQIQNGSSGAYGIPQALPGSKMASAGADWRTNPVTQIRWGLGYIADRYGSPCGAWAHSESHNWY